MATTRSRSREGREAISVSTPRWCIAVRTAWTWPWWRDASPWNSVALGVSGSSRNTRRSRSTFAGGQWLRLARVRFLTFPPSRYPSRRRIAGGDPRLGTVAMYMPTQYGSSVPCVKLILARAYLFTCQHNPTWNPGNLLICRHFLGKRSGNFSLEVLVQHCSGRARAGAATASIRYVSRTLDRW